MIPQCDSAVVHLQGIPSQFTKYVMIGHNWTCPAPRIIRVRASPHNDSAVFHLKANSAPVHSKECVMFGHLPPGIISTIRGFPHPTPPQVSFAKMNISSKFMRVRNDWTPPGTAHHRHHPGQGFARNSVPISQGCLMIGPTQHCASSASSGSGLPDDSAVLHLTNTIRSSSQEVRDDGTRQALCISIIRVRASRPNVCIVFICKGTPSQFTRVQHDCTCPAQRIISIIRVRVSPHSDSAVFHLQGIPSQFTKYVMIGPAWHRASSASSGPGLPSKFFICICIEEFRPSLQRYMMSGSARHRASSASSGSGLPEAMIPQFFICM